jgi:hypothetical protein
VMRGTGLGPKNMPHTDPAQGQHIQGVNIQFPESVNIWRSALQRGCMIKYFGQRPLFAETFVSACSTHLSLYTL